MRSSDWSSDVCSSDLTTEQGKGRTVFHLFDRSTLAHVGAVAGESVANTDGIWLHDAPSTRFPEGALYAVHDDQGMVALDWRAIAGALYLHACPRKCRRCRLARWCWPPAHYSLCSPRRPRSRAMRSARRSRTLSSLPEVRATCRAHSPTASWPRPRRMPRPGDRKSTRLNSSH